MEIGKLQVEARSGSGSRQAGRLRRAGNMPAVIYGHGQEAEHIVVGQKALASLVEHGAHVIELSGPGRAQPVLIKDVQYDHLGIHPIHADFVRVDMNEKVTVSVPLEFRGTPVGIQEGGIFDEQVVDLEVEVLATQIPSSIRVNVGELKLGQWLQVRDIVLPEGVKAITPAEAIICAVRAKAAEVEAAAPAEGESTGPEIITARDRDKEEEKEKD